MVQISDTETWRYDIRILFLGICLVTCQLDVSLAESKADFNFSRNVDHFFFIDVQELEQTSLPAPSSFSNDSYTNSSFVGPELRHGPHLASGRYKIRGRSANNGLQDELKKDFGEMPGPEILKMKDYVVVNVAPSVIPIYLPGVRVFSYVRPTLLRTCLISVQVQH